MDDIVQRVLQVFDDPGIFLLIRLVLFFCIGQLLLQLFDLLVL